MDLFRELAQPQEADPLAGRIAGWCDKPVYEPAPPVAMNPWYSQTADEQRDRSGCCVYLIEAGEHYKIGITTNLEQRVADINNGLPHATAVVVAVRAGGRDLEARLHDELAHRRVKGEWFDKCEEVYAAFLLLPHAAEQDERIA